MLFPHYSYRLQRSPQRRDGTWNQRSRNARLFHTWGKGRTSSEWSGRIYVRTRLNGYPRPHLRMFLIAPVLILRFDAVLARP